jgi:hypothetical protein
MDDMRGIIPRHLPQLTGTPFGAGNILDKKIYMALIKR